MIEDYYRKGRNYEILIRRAFNCEKGKRHGADSELYVELIALELGNDTSIKYKWRLQKLKNYIGYALTKLRKRKRYIGSDDEFSPIQFMLNNVRNADDLAKVASQGLSKIIECENRLRDIS